MENINVIEIVGKLGQEAVRIESRAHALSASFQTRCTKTEELKIDILKQGLANSAKSLARQAGFKSIVRDRNNLGVSLTAAGIGIAFGAALTGDGLSALASGISGFDGALQELGKSKWAVSLDGDFLITHSNRITPGRTWVTLESLLLALEDLRGKAHAGEQFGDISALVAALKRSQTKLQYLLPVTTQWVAVSQGNRTTG
jgi:hypothetical protein